jgi:CDP-4-dehydro-6-deoxyglucose reductase
VSDLDQTILEAARNQGIALEHSCRTGRCGVFKARVRQGETNPLKSEEPLTEDEKSEGFVLACCRTGSTELLPDIEDIGELS